MDFETWKRRREEMMREAERNRLAKKLRASREPRGPGRMSGIAWDLARISGRMVKLLKSLKKRG